MFATAIVLFVLAALANTLKFIYLLSGANKGGEGMKRIGVLLRVNGLAFGLGVVAFVMEKYVISVALFAASILAAVALAVIARRQPDSTDVSR